MEGDAGELPFNGFGDDDVPVRKVILRVTDDEEDSKASDSFMESDILDENDSDKEETGVIGVKSLKEKKGKKGELKMLKKAKLEAAAAYIKSGKVQHFRSAAITHGVPYSSLWQGVNKQQNKFYGIGGRQSKVMTKEKNKIVDHVQWKVGIGYGVTWEMLQLCSCATLCCA